MAVTLLKLNQVRSHSNAAFKFIDGLNAIVGPNGSGKTTILEAVYTLAHGSSFRGSIGELTQYGTDGSQMQLTYSHNASTQLRSLGVVRTELAIQKKWQVEGKKYARLPHSLRLPVVLFEPDLARLITGSPERRRQYLDGIAGQLDIEVGVAQTRFERVLRQRNQLLKSLSPNYSLDPPEQLFIWNTQLAHLSERIIQGRLEVIAALQLPLSDYYRDLGGEDDIFLSYLSDVSTNPNVYASNLLQFLETSFRRDVVLGHTTFGPHRDDLEFRLADQLAIERASRGEIRSMVIACKLLETELLAKHYRSDKIKPLLLLDDVLSELDLAHQERVLRGFKDYQVFITTTDAHTLTPETHTIALD